MNEEKDEIMIEDENKLPEGVLEVDLNHEMKESFLSYAMSVIVARAPF